MLYNTAFYKLYKNIPIIYKGKRAHEASIFKLMHLVHCNLKASGGSNFVLQEIYSRFVGIAKSFVLFINIQVLAMITGLHLMCSEDTRLQSACYRAGIQVVGKLKTRAMLVFCSSHPRMINMEQWHSTTVLQVNDFHFLQTGKRAKTLQLVKQGKNHDKYLLYCMFFFLSTFQSKHNFLCFIQHLTKRLSLKLYFHVTFQQKYPV